MWMAALAMCDLVHYMKIDYGILLKNDSGEWEIIKTNFTPKAQVCNAAMPSEYCHSDRQ